MSNNCEYKQQEALDAFKRIGKLSDIKMLPIIGSDETIHYRNKLEFTFSNKKFLTRLQMEDLGNNVWPGGALGYHVPLCMIKSLTFMNAGLWMM